MQIYLRKDGQQDGPYEIEQIKQLLEEGKVNQHDPAFFDNCKDWSTISKIPGMEAVDGQNLEIGSSFGQYKVTGQLGQGGMGEVYEVVHEVLGTKHALKLLSPEVMDVPGALERFEREAKVMARLKHPGIVGVDDFGETDGRYWLRMELMEGRKLNEKQVVTLDEYVKAKGGRLPEEEAKEILNEILQALFYAHEKGLIHQDLKPANILFDAEQLKISDFGLVNATGAEWMNPQTQSTVVSEQQDETLVESSGTSSRSRAIMGTFSFMSPEQKLGQSADHRSDLFAIGLIAFRLFTDKTPGFKAPSVMVEGLSNGWDNWLQRALEHDPSDRFDSASEMAEALNFPRESSSDSPNLKFSSTADDSISEDHQADQGKQAKETFVKISRKASIVLQEIRKKHLLAKFLDRIKKLKRIQIVAGISVFLILFSTLLLSGGKSPGNPEDFGVEVLQLVADDDIDSFLDMTMITLTLSEWKEIWEDLRKRRVSQLEEEMEKATEKSEKRNIEDEIEEFKYQLEYDLEFTTLDLFLGSTLEILDYEDWKSLKEDFKNSKIDALEQKIEIIDDSQKAAAWKKSLATTKTLTFGKADYNTWKDKTTQLKESWSDAIEKIRKDGKDKGINWDDIEFEYVDFDKKNRDEVKYFSVDVAFSHREKVYEISFGSCLNTSLGTLINKPPKGPVLVD